MLWNVWVGITMLHDVASQMVKLPDYNDGVEFDGVIKVKFYYKLQ